ncbi:hypothetical protein ACLRDC_07745 [Gluconacetobacter sacchari]|uniref:hypothetical protein n=1 Tax=Gluconacetobacter sacchari TaxID=92759 RepID=UPI0039B6B951
MPCITRTWIQPAPPVCWMLTRPNWLDNFFYTLAMLPVRMAEGFGGAVLVSVLFAAALWWLVWVDAFSTFNVWSYAPLRVLTTHGDMALLARGLGVSVWVLFPFVTSFAAWLVWRFAFRALPLAQKRLDPDDGRSSFSMVVLAISVPFFSMSGLSGYGPFCAVLATVSFFMMMPVLMAAQRTGAGR